MTASGALGQLQPLVGTELGAGDWTVLSPDRIRAFADAVGPSSEVVPNLMLLSLIPALTATITLPIESPRMAVNYGLDACRPGKQARAGERVRARATLIAVEEGGTWLQIKRQVTLENEAGEAVLQAETLARLFW